MFEKRSDLIKFLTVVETGKIQMAAQKLNIAQPALSRLISKMEEQFGSQLFERVPSGVRLTPFGSNIAKQARHLVREMELAEAEVQSNISGRTGNLRITAGPMWMLAIIPKVINQFHKDYPGIELQLHTATYQEGLEFLVNGESDLHCGGFDTDEPLPQFLKRDHVLDMNLGVVAHVEHPIFEKKKPTYNDLVEYPWLGYDANSYRVSESDWPSLSDILEELFEKTGKRVGTIVQCDAAGLFLMSTAPYLAHLSLNFAKDLSGLPLKHVPLDFSQRTFRSGIVSRRSIEGTSAFQYFKELLHKEAKPYAI